MRLLMHRRYLEQRQIVVDSGQSCLVLEREYWQVPTTELDYSYRVHLKMPACRKQ